MEKITIEGKEYKKINSLAELAEQEEFIMLKEIKQPTFSVGMRVEFGGFWSNFTYKMVYRISKENNTNYFVIDDRGEECHFLKVSMNSFFTPYEKPKKGEDVWYIDSLFAKHWHEEVSTTLWNLGLAFKTKEQAEFARKRLSKLF